MFAFVITVHIIACFLLIIIVLIQQGKGGGLIDTLSSAESIFGTKTNTFLVKATSVLSVIFFFTCLSLAFLSIQRNKSLIDTTYRKTSRAPLTKTHEQTTAATSRANQQSAAAPQTMPVPAPKGETPAPAAAQNAAPVQQAGGTQAANTAAAPQQPQKTDATQPQTTPAQ